MPRPPADYRALHQAADYLEPSMAMAFRRAVERIRKGVDINALAMKLAAKDVRGALALLPLAAVKDALSPAATIARDATLRGGRVGAAAVSRALR